MQDCSPQDVPTKLPDIVGQSVLLALCVLLLVFAYNEKIFKEKPQLLYLFSAAVAVGLEVRAWPGHDRRALMTHFCKLQDRS